MIDDIDDPGSGDAIKYRLLRILSIDPLTVLGSNDDERLSNIKKDVWVATGASGGIILGSQLTFRALNVRDLPSITADINFSHNSDNVLGMKLLFDPGAFKDDECDVGVSHIRFRQTEPIENPLAEEDYVVQTPQAAESLETPDAIQGMLDRYGDANVFTAFVVLNSSCPLGSRNKVTELGESTFVRDESGFKYVILTINERRYSISSSGEYHIWSDGRWNRITSVDNLQFGTPTDEVFAHLLTIGPFEPLKSSDQASATELRTQVDIYRRGNEVPALGDILRLDKIGSFGEHPLNAHHAFLPGNLEVLWVYHSIWPITVGTQECAAGVTYFVPELSEAADHPEIASFGN